MNRLIGSALVVVLASCSGTGVSPSEVNHDSNSVLSNDSRMGSPGVNPSVLGEPTECEVIGITARRVLSVSPGEVTLLVNANYSGAMAESIYVRLSNAVTGESYGDYPLGVITLTLNPGDYRLFIFVEVQLDTGVIQCDGSLSFTIPSLPPPPPVCQGDDCEPLECEEDCEEEPEFDECAEFSGPLCHATGTQNPVQLNFEDGIPPGHCKHFLFRHSPGQGPKDFPGVCVEES